MCLNCNKGDSYDSRQEEIRRTEVPTAGENITPKTGQADKRTSFPKLRAK